MAGEPWKRIKQSPATTAPGVGGTITVAFDESTPLNSTHTLVAVVQFSGAAGDVSNSWGATPISASGSNGSNNYLGVLIVPGDSVKNGITLTFSVAQAQAAVTLMAFEGFVSATPHTSGVANQAASTTSLAGPPSAATSVANTIALVMTALSTGGGGTWGTWDSGFFSAPISQSRLHVGAKALTTSAQSPSSSITHTSSRAKRVLAITIQGTAPAANAAPTVSVGADKHALVGDTVATTATAADSDGTIATYNWTVVSCDVTAPTLSGATTATATFVPDRPMTVTLRCTVEDNGGASASDDVVIRVSIARAPSGITKGLIAEWNFAEASAPFFTQDGALPLSAVGSVPRVATPWGYGVDIDGSPNYLRILSDNLGALNMGDWGGKVTVAAWVKRQDLNTGFVAGGWQEDSADPRRQYGLFIDLGAYGGSLMSCFHVSKLGGPTPGFAFSKDYAASGATVTNDVWEFHVGTYDGAEARSYLNGAFTSYPTFTDSDGQTYAKNPYAYADGLNATPVDFTVGAVKLTAGMGNFFDGQIAKLRIWDRAITSAEVAALYAAEIPGSISSADPVGVTDTAALARAVAPADAVGVTDSVSAVLTPGGGSTPWLNRVVIAAPRNGTTTHAIDPTSSTGVVSGTAFTPTAGRLLVCVVEGSVTSATPTGWTLPSGGSAINITGLYLWTKTAASGSNAFSTTHNASNYPAVFAIYEFPAGTSLVTVAASISQPATGATAALSGMPTTSKLLMAAVANGIGSGHTVTTVWDSPLVEDLDTQVAASGTDGYGLSISYIVAFTSATATPGFTQTRGGAGTYNAETLSFALSLPAGGTDYTAGPTDAAGITDAVTDVLTADRVASDGVGVTDSAAVSRAMVLVFTDGVGVSDVAAPSSAAVVTVTPADPVGVSDTVAVQMADVLTSSETVGVTDAAAAVATADRQATDPVSVTDSVSAVLVAAGTFTAADTIAVTDTTSTVTLGSRDVGDTVSVTDTVNAVLVTAGTLTPTDTLAVTDTSSTALAAARTVDDAVGVTDSVSAVLVAGGSYTATPADTVSAADGTATVAASVRTLLDAVGLSDAVTAVLNASVVTPPVDPTMTLTVAVRSLTVTPRTHTMEVR